ncbi:hypothetical protein B9Z19DRAFT_986387, partial [Tuber borchii]
TPTSFSTLPVSHSYQSASPVHLLASHTLRLLYSPNFVVDSDFGIHLVVLFLSFLLPPLSARKVERYNISKGEFRGGKEKKKRNERIFKTLPQSIDRLA